MKITDGRELSAQAISALMRKKAFDQVVLSPRVQAGVTEMFGAPLTAAQVVDKIVEDVKNEGDKKLFYYTNLLDKAGVSKRNIRVSKKEFSEAEKLVDKSVKVIKL